MQNLWFRKPANNFCLSQVPMVKCNCWPTATAMQKSGPHPLHRKATLIGRSKSLHLLLVGLRDYCGIWVAHTAWIFSGGASRLRTISVGFSCYETLPHRQELRDNQLQNTEPTRKDLANSTIPDKFRSHFLSVTVQNSSPAPANQDLAKESCQTRCAQRRGHTL